jgi:hypothetical protein
LGGKKGSVQDDQLKIDKDKIKTLGGLFVIGQKEWNLEELIIRQEEGLVDKEMRVVLSFM